MLRLKTVSALLFSAAALLASVVFILHFLILIPFKVADHVIDPSDPLRSPDSYVPLTARTAPETTLSASFAAVKDDNGSNRACQEKTLSIEQYRARSLLRGVIVRFPSSRSDYYLTQFRWFYRSWIESETFTLERWRTDIIVLIDDRLANDTQHSLAQLGCHVNHQRTTRQQESRCIVVLHPTFSQRSSSQRQAFADTYPALTNAQELHSNVDRLLSIADYTSRLNETQAVLYDFLLVTTMNTFLTTQFGKYVPIRCAFLIGTSPDYSTWYGRMNQIVQFVHQLLLTAKQAKGDRQNMVVDYPLAIETLRSALPFAADQVDVPCDSSMTTYRTSIYHLKCYAHSTSLFSEKMFRENAYDGFENQPFNIYIAREYATLMALQSKVMSIKDLHSLAINVTHRDIN